MKTQQPPRLAVALQTSPIDAHIALGLMELIVSIEKEPRTDIDFIISARRGTNPEAVQRLRDIACRRFSDVKIIEGKRFGNGWPEGCNDLWAETMMRVSLMRKAKQITSSGVLTFEPDCLPLRPDWLDVLKAEWVKADAEGHECLGSISGEPPDHINGNAIFSCDILRRHMELNGAPATSGWDSYHGKLLLEIGADTPYITQIYKKPGITRDELLAIRKDGHIPAILHGVKGTDGLSVVNGMIQDGAFFARK